MISCYEVLYRLLCILLCAAVCGCGAAEESTIPEVTPTVKEQIASPVPDQTSESDNNSQEADSDRSSATDEQAAQKIIETIAYTPPYPERENPFQTPQRMENVDGSGVGNSDDDIQLLGFANVNGQKAIISINGMVVPIAEGGLDSGIEVISIHPPAVVLQRNHQRWQESLDY